MEDTSIDRSGWSTSLGDDIARLWSDSAIRDVYDEHDPRYQLAESAP